MSKALFRTPDGQSALFFTLFGVLTVVLGSQYPIGTPAQMGPGFFPVALGSLLTIVGIVVAIGAIRAGSAFEMAAVDWRALGAITAAILLAAVLLLTAGLVVAIPVLVIVGSLASRDFRPVRVFITAVVLTVMAWAIFIWGLGLRIPVWWN
jgi:hypothetical protein